MAHCGSLLLMTIQRRLVISVLLAFLAFNAAAQGVPGSKRQVKVDLVVRSEITFDRPVREVWPHFVEMGKWMTQIHLQSVGGVSGQEGEIRLVRPADDHSAAGYTIKTVRIVPLEQYVVKVVSENPVFDGYGDFSFAESDGKTRMVYDIYMEFLVPEMSEEKFRQFAAAQRAGSLKRMDENNNRLKLLVEKGALR